MTSNKKINFYFHDDVDGLTCSALFYEFIKTRGYEIGELIPMNYGGNLYSKWKDIELRHTSVVVDFRYHPSADWFFDHHTSSFMSKEWQDDFVVDDKHFFDEKYPSCFGLVLDSLIGAYDFKPSALMKKLRTEVDMLDSAKYPSAKYYVLLEGPIAQFDILLERLRKKNKVPYKFFIKSLNRKSVADLLKIKKFKRILFNIKKEISYSLSILPQNINIESHVSIIDGAKFKTHLPRYSDYYLYPDLEYSITVKKSKSVYTVSVGKNPWSELPSVLHLGRLQQTYGGGGHENAAGSEASTHDEAMQRAQTIRDIIIKALKLS